MKKTVKRKHGKKQKKREKWADQEKNREKNSKNKKRSKIEIFSRKFPKSSASTNHDSVSRSQPLQHLVDCPDLQI